ncbi:histone deacetylase [Spirulina subsalsa FACHB-351]|uniref:Histone deacetylase n=1 Tax=Spirulina subsalsa FACHB-351 TaxID=234711 RepID=A0ABT3LAC7_9CYAN|nr:histone deacetylase [Spirulina subsalsa]MCW6038468.1 histone deacetylase [Spirulina subsalsa FACHB-351]
MFPIIYSDRFLDHDTGSFHPERPARLTAIVNALKAASFAHQLTWHYPTPLTERNVLPWVLQVHTPDYLEEVQAIARRRGGGILDPDTPVSQGSYDIALLAVSGWLDGVDQVLANNRPAFVAARPPGHHAEPQRGMGFCLFSNAAIAAHYALEQPDIQRVAIFDWDVHHGNGTQCATETDPQMAYCSLHQSPFYPGTGQAYERGMYKNVLNIPLRAGSTVREYESVIKGQVIPFLQHFQPDLILVSAGYDANADDPLAGMKLYPEDYGQFTRLLLPLTPRLLFGLEGGYDLDSLGQSVVETVSACLSLG